MHNTDDTTTKTAKGAKPAFRAWLVTEGPNGKDTWTELAALWPSRSGAGHSGPLARGFAATTGRIVILPAHEQTEG